MHNLTVGIVGASGYSGLELTRLLANHPGVQLRFATSDRWLGETLGKRAGVDGPTGALTYVKQSDAEALARECAVVFLATPAEASLELAPKLLATGCRVIDLSGAFRLQSAEAYPKHYGFTHRAPDLLAQAVYGLPELCRGRIREAKFVANPGCFPTASSLPLLPLLRRGLLDQSTRIIIDAASGVSGAGRKASEDYAFCEVDGDFRAYKVHRHQHTPEIAQTLGMPVTFTPHLLPIKRGILCTTYANLASGVTAKDVAAAMEEAYGSEPFVRIAGSADEVALKHVVGTNRCELGWSIDGSQLILISAIDNLVKGAAGQAVQNMNLLLGFAETEGLASARGVHP